MNTFTINGKEYKAKPFDFNTVCDLEDMGINLEQAQHKPMGMVRAYFGICAGMGRERAGKEMEAHITGGGGMDGLMEAMMKEMNESDFFRKIGERAEAEAGQGQTEAK